MNDLSHYSGNDLKELLEHLETRKKELEGIPQYIEDVEEELVKRYQKGED